MADKEKATSKGRPTAISSVDIRHEMREEKPEVVKEYWTEHRITLIAYEAQYIRNKKPEEEKVEK